MASIENLTPGTRVRIPNRQNAIGTVEAKDPIGSWSRKLSTARPTVDIKLDGHGYVMNYPEDVEIITD